MEDLVIRHTSKVIYAVLNNGSKAFIRYSVENNVMKLKETYTPPQYRGKGIAKKLMDYAIELAQSNNWLIEPICSYAVYYFIKNPDKKNVLIPKYREMSEEELKELFKRRVEEESGKN